MPITLFQPSGVVSRTSSKLVALAGPALGFQRPPMLSRIIPGPVWKLGTPREREPGIVDPSARGTEAWAHRIWPTSGCDVGQEAMTSRLAGT